MAVIDARFGHDVLRAGRIRIKFPAQVADVDTQVMLGSIFFLLTPDQADALLVGEHLTSVEYQYAQDVVLGVCQGNLLSIEY